MRFLKTMSVPHRLLAPFFAVMGLFFVAPAALVVVYSFLKPGIAGGIVWQLSWDAYIRLLFERDFDGTTFFNPGYIDVFLRSVRLAALSTFWCLLAGFPTAYFMATRPTSKRDFWILMITIPFWTNLLIRTYAWLLILRVNGPINNLLALFGVTPLPMLYNDFAVAVGLLYSYLPFMILPVYSSLEKMDWNLVEASQDLYAGRWRTLLNITLPQCLPGILAGIILVFIPAVGSFLAPDLLGSGKEMMIGNLIQLQFGFSRNWPFGSALSIILMAIVMLGLMAMARKGGRVRSVLQEA